MITEQRGHPGRRMPRAAAAPASLLALSLLAGACVDQPERLTAPIEMQAAKAAPDCTSRTADNVQKLTACVTLDGVRTHQVMLRNIANQHFDIRASGTPGYDGSASYVADLLADAGYNVTIQPFQFQGFVQRSPSVLTRLSPEPAGSIEHVVLEYSGNGDIAATVTPLPASPVDATPGCEAADFTGFTPGHIALIERGGCLFATKATNAFAALASGVVMYNNIEGDINGTLSNTFALDIPVAGVTQAVGQLLAATPDLVLGLAVNAARGVLSTSNVIAETTAGDPGNAVVIGAHLDSDDSGPGINNNGSGVAAVLETALQMAGAKPRNQVRFAFWGAHEQGLFGSNFYLQDLGEAGRAAVALYIDADMLASPNYALFVLEGNEAIGDVFRSFYAERGLPSEAAGPVPVSAASSFENWLIPVGGITTGATELKTLSQQLAFGGAAGQPYDPCYHLACDNLFNTSLPALDLNSDAIATATITFAMSTELVNGKKGKGRAPKPVTATVTGKALATR